MIARERSIDHEYTFRLHCRSRCDVCSIVAKSDVGCSDLMTPQPGLVVTALRMRVNVAAGRALPYNWSDTPRYQTSSTPIKLLNRVRNGCVPFSCNPPAFPGDRVALSLASFFQPHPTNDRAHTTVRSRSRTRTFPQDRPLPSPPHESIRIPIKVAKNVVRGPFLFSSESGSEPNEILLDSD